MELYCVCNFKQWMVKGLYLGMLMVGFEQKVMGGNVLWMLYYQYVDYEMLKLVLQCELIVYLKLDGKLMFDWLLLVFILNMNYEENQLVYLMLKDVSVLVNVNLCMYVGLEVCFCLVVVYEFVKNDDGGECFVINVQNCVYCKICDIKDLMQNIVWVMLEGGGGLNYLNM